MSTAHAYQGESIPADCEIGACWALGYPGNPDDLAENLKNREIAPRSRKPIADFVLRSGMFRHSFERTPTLHRMNLRGQP